MRDKQETVSGRPPAIFRSAAELFASYGGTPTETAIAFYNCHTGAKSAALRYPEDAEEIFSHDTAAGLPGALLYKAAEEQAEHAAFVRYLRKGVPPAVPEEIRQSASRMCSCLHLKAAQPLHEKRETFPAGDPALYKEEKIATAYEYIYAAARNSETTVENAEKAHLRTFLTQIRKLTGEAHITIDEPYLIQEKARFRLQFLQTLERLSGVFARQIAGRRRKDDTGFEEKAINPRLDIAAQVQARLDTETERFRFRFGQTLDGRRQQAFGLRKYIWRTEDDARVRASHRRNDDNIFAWDAPPPTGHPGEDYGCRCLAEPTLQDAGEPRIDTAFAIAPGLVYAAEAAAILGRIYVNTQKARRAAAAARGASAVLNGIPEEDGNAEEKPENTQLPSEQPPEEPEPEDNRIEKPPLRLEYEAVVRGLKELEDKLREEGKSPEEIARTLSRRRRAIGRYYKSISPPEFREKAFKRNIHDFGDKWGPAIKWFLNRGDSWEDIIKSSQKPGGLDFFKFMRLIYAKNSRY